MAKRIRKDRWNVWATGGYSRDVANDQRSAGGVHHFEVRRIACGWQGRICQSNGSYHAYGAYESLDEAEGERRFAIAQEETRRYG